MSAGRGRSTLTLFVRSDLAIAISAFLVQASAGFILPNRLRFENKDATLYSPRFRFRSWI